MLSRLSVLRIAKASLSSYHRTMSASRGKRKTSAVELPTEAPAAKRNKTKQSAELSIDDKLRARIKFTPTDGKVRCIWSLMGGPLDVEYHDNEWGRAVHDDIKLFEMLALEGFQAGLSWSTILAKRTNFLAAFDGFDPKVVSQYDSKKVSELLQNAGIVRHRGKIEATIQNAKIVMEIQQEFGSFDAFIWSFVDSARPKVNHPQTLSEIKSKTEQSDALSNALKKRGMKFVGSTIVYAFMQACGLVNDHTTDCWAKSALS